LAFEPLSGTAESGRDLESVAGLPVPISGPAGTPRRSGCQTMLSGCGLTLVVAIVLLVGGCALWRAFVPKDVGYDDVLTKYNAGTFAAHNKNWDNDNPDNVTYVQRAMQHLGSKAYGHTFGGLMDWEKFYEGIDESAPDGWKSSELALSPEVRKKRQEEAREDATPAAPPPSELPASDDGPFIDGYTAEVSQKADGAPCFASKEQLNAFLDAMDKHDTYGEQKAAADAVTLRAGDRVRAIEHGGFMWSLVRVRIESGNNAGAACWDEADIGAFVNVKRDGD